MSRIIKALGRESGVAILQPAASAVPATQPPPSEADMLRDALEERDAELQAMRADNERLAAMVPEARREGEAAGRAAGLREAEGHAAEALRRLDAGIAAAMDELSGRMTAMDRLAVQLARSALEQVFETPGRAVDQIQSAVRRQLAQLEASTVVRIEVSPEDFSSAVDLDRLRAALGPNLEVTTPAELAAGECHIRLTLGGLEVGPRQQWRRLSQMLDALAEPAL